MAVKYGTCQLVGVAAGTLRNSQGVEILCICGKEAESAIIGKSTYVAYCKNCSLTPNYSAELIYRPNSSGCNGML